MLEFQCSRPHCLITCNSTIPVGGFLAAVRLQTPRKLRLLLCLAENAIGPASVRNDDIITQYSGKTVEINNSDAEGRLVLSDAVAHATKHFEDVGLVMDMATLTGAQLIATGKMHAGILANSLELERRAVDAGLVSGDLCYPLLYAPELLKKVRLLVECGMYFAPLDTVAAQFTND